MNPITLLVEFHEWLDTVQPEFLFLLALPFLVAAAGLLVHRHKSEEEEPSIGSRIGVPASIAAALALIVSAAT